MAQQTLDNNVLLSEQRAKINNNALDALSQSDTTTQNLASDVDFAAGKGVSFDGGDTLGAYEALGTFTPTLTTNATDFSSITYEIQSGDYTIIGDRLFFTAHIKTTSITVGSASGVLKIGGLPLPSAATSLGQPCYVGYRRFWANNPETGYIENSDTEIFLYYTATHGSDTTNLAVSSANVGATSNELIISGSYPI